MTNISYKKGLVFTYKLLNAIFAADNVRCEQSTIALANWLVNSPIEDDSLLINCVRILLPVMQKIDGKLSVTEREYNKLQPAIEKFCEYLMSRVETRMYVHKDSLTSGMTSSKNRRSFNVLKYGFNSVAKSDNNSVNVLITSNTAVAVPRDKFDIVITLNELLSCVRKCCAIDNFSYDRLYLTGKLERIAKNRNTSILLAGSSYVMVGLLEKLMPGEAVNVAVNAQDPYFTFLTSEIAVLNNPQIKTVVIGGSYYFWNVDVSDNPSDYYKSVLTRINYPVLKDIRSYSGEILPLYRRNTRDPLLESFFDFDELVKALDHSLSRKIADLPYFNGEFYPRPAYGMLNFPFKQQTDATNKNASKLRAQAHNNCYNTEHLNNNLKLFSEFLDKMYEKNIQVIMFVPPVTHFYREHSSPEMKETFYAAFKPLLNEDNKFTFVDLFDSPLFTLDDFRDYDHLDDAGAVKLSEFISTLIKQKGD